MGGGGVSRVSRLRSAKLGQDLDRAQHGEIGRRPIVAAHTRTLVWAAPSAASAIVAKYARAIAPRSGAGVCSTRGSTTPRQAAIARGIEDAPMRIKNSHAIG